MSESIFVLDIGTRTVVALWASFREGAMYVEHILTKEHQTRAMFDGQIHHVEEVVNIVEKLVRQMEQLVGREIKQVAVAAAGRTLETVKGSTEMVHPISSVFTKEEVLALELEAVEEAQASLPTNADLPLSLQYYCVGYSIVQEYLDDVPIGSLVGQKGEKARIEIIATFLPRMVVDSLQNVVEKAGLEIVSLTLEPIAVANLVLNPAMRRLNLVLVDIGAGTSDIAVCGENFISAFGMVPLAGDEISEAISGSFLLDFHRAEDVKKQLLWPSEIKTVDILGQERILYADEIKNGLRPVLEKVAGAIAEKILELNGKSPQALLLVGGGSLTTGLQSQIAAAISLSEERVAVQQAAKVQGINNLPEEFNGPHFITAMAIAYTALTNSTMSFITVYINDTPVRMLNLAQNNVAGALLAGGYNLRELYARPGMAITYELNGELFTVPGGEGEPGQVLLNGEAADFGDPVFHEARLTFIPGKKGVDAQITCAELLKEQLITYWLNGEEIKLLPRIKVGEQYLAADDFVRDGSKIEIEHSYQVGEVLQQAGLLNKFIKLNGQQMNLGEFIEVRKNGEIITLYEMVNPGDALEFSQAPVYLSDVLPKEAMVYIEVMVNGQPVKLNCLQVWLNNTKVNSWDKIKLKHGDVLEYQTEGSTYQPILVDVFNVLDFSTTPPPGKTKLIILLNGLECEYTHPLQAGDVIEFHWE